MILQKRQDLVGYASCVCRYGKHDQFLFGKVPVCVSDSRQRKVRMLKRQAEHFRRGPADVFRRRFRLSGSGFEQLACAYKRQKRFQTGRIRAGGDRKRFPDRLARVIVAAEGVDRPFRPAGKELFGKKAGIRIAVPIAAAALPAVPPRTITRMTTTTTTIMTTARTKATITMTTTTTIMTTTMTRARPSATCCWAS